jgi:hypothetical protein
MLGPGSRIIIDAVLLDLQNFLNLLDFGILRETSLGHLRLSATSLRSK